MKFELNLDNIGRSYSHNTVEFEFRKTLLNDGEDYGGASDEYLAFAENGGWIIKTGIVGGESNSNGIDLCFDENNSKDVLKEVFDYLFIYSYPKNLNSLIGYMWDDLYNEEASEKEMQERFDELGSIIVKYYRELEKFQR